MTPIRVLIADDQHLVREGIASLLAIQPGITIVGTAANGKEAIEQAASSGPDIVLMDVRMPEMDGVAATAHLTRHNPTCKVIMLTTFNDEDYVVRALQAGATGYLLKDLPAAELAEAIRLTNAGVTQLHRAATEHVAAALAARQPTTLTAREAEVLSLIAAGATNREIAKRLYLSEGTVKNHISRILNRLGLRDRTQAALYARDHNIL